MSNQQVVKLLRNVAAAYTIKNEEKFRFQIIAYQKAVDTITNLTSELKDYYTEDKLDKLPGIGPTLRLHLIELFKKKKVRHFEWVLKGIPKSVFTLMDIPTFGPKKAYKLVHEFKLNDSKTVIADLEKLAGAGKIANIEGFGEKSEADILRAISEFKEGKGKITKMTLPYALAIAEKIISYLKNFPEIEKTEALGSLRRRAPTVGDIDIAAMGNNAKKIIEYFINYPSKERVIEKGDISASIMVSGGKQVDLLVQPSESFGSLLQHFTGNKNHNVHLREIALKSGLSLSEYGIKNLKLKNSPIKKYSNEEEFYNAIGLQWIPPELREDKGEIEASKKNNLPDLVVLSDLKGDLHIHSNYPIEPSHDLGADEMQTMLKKAKNLNYNYLGFSEHNPSISKHSGQKIYEILNKRNEYINQLQSNMKNVRIFKLLEIDILPNGNLAIDNNSLDLLDGAIVSIHSLFSMNKDEMTKRVINGLSHKKAKILAHPTGRIINERSGFELDWEKLFEFCKKYNKALEINSWPARLDLPDNIIKLAVENNIKLVINSDSHSLKQMDLIKYGVFMARRGWATKGDILNTLSYNSFSEWLKK